MPRLSRLQSPALDDLAAQLRFAPKAALLKQIDRAEELASELEEIQTYPEDWLIFRITGFSPDLGSPRLLRGDEVLADLSSLVERLSDAARLDDTDAPPNCQSVPALCERWKITRRTLERYRRQGLVARRIRDARDPRRVHLVFAPGCVAAFERRTNTEPTSTAALVRLSQEERIGFISWARRYHARTGCTLNQAARKLARRSGRAIETIRRVLQQHDATAKAGQGAIFAERGPLTSRDRRLAWRATRWGIAPAALVERLDRSLPTVHRIINERRLELLRRIELAETEAQDALDAAGEAAALAPISVRQGLGAPVPRSIEAFVSLRDQPAKAATFERELAAAYIALRARAHRMRQSAVKSGSALNATSLDRMETDLRWAILIKRELLRAVLGVVVRSVEERAGVELSALDPPESVRLLQQALNAAGDAIDRFDSSKRGRLAAPVSLSINRVLAGAEAGLATASAPLGTSARPQARRRQGGEVQLPDWSSSLAPWQAWLEPDARLELAAASLQEPLLRSALSARVGWSGEAPKTAAEIEVQLGVTRARLARAYRLAMAVVHRISAVG